MTAIFSLEQWFEITDKVGTSGDQISDILYSWKDDREKLLASLEKEHARVLSLQSTVRTLTRKLQEAQQ